LTNGSGRFRIGGKSSPGHDNYSLRRTTMEVCFRTLVRTVCTLAVVLMLVAGAGVEAAAKGQKGRRWGRDDNGRHRGWTRGRHRGWEHSRSRHVRDDWWESRRDRRRSRRDRRRDRWDSRRDRRRDRREARRDRRDDRRDWRRLRRNRDRRVAIYRNY
jgi:hypothetical protein